MYTVGSLYAGVGGICQGFINAGAEIKWANEFDKHACITYRMNFKHKLHEADIWSLEPNELEPVDILAAGFPCQPFSVAGYRKGFADERGNHFVRIIQYAIALKPKVIFLENVKNLKGHDNGNTFNVIKTALLDKGYSFNPAVLNTKDYGNIPHNRERIFIVCFKDEPDGSNLNDPCFAYPLKEKLTKTIKDIIEQGEVDEKYYYRENKYMYKMLAQAIISDETVYQFRRVYVRGNKNKLCPTLTANMGTGGHNVPLIKTDYGIRKLTPRECFSFQGFPKTYKLSHAIAPSHYYKQAGNSVSVPVITRIAQNIIKALNQEPIVFSTVRVKSGADVMEVPSLFQPS